MNDAMWPEIRQAFEWVDATPEARVAILSGAGKNFCAGIDLACWQHSATHRPRRRRAAAKPCAA
jgi:enoyl-CoA hydratase/carnithine racemase